MVKKRFFHSSFKVRKKFFNSVSKVAKKGVPKVKNEVFLQWFYNDKKRRFSGVLAGTKRHCADGEKDVLPQ